MNDKVFVFAISGFIPGGPVCHGNKQFLASARKFCEIFFNQEAGQGR